MEDVPCMFLCVMNLMTAETPRSRCRKMFAGWAELDHPLLPVETTGPERGRVESNTLVQGTELFIFCVMSSYDLSVSFLLIHRSLYPNENSQLILLCHNLSLKKHIIGNDRVVKCVGADSVTRLTAGALLLLASIRDSPRPNDFKKHQKISRLPRSIMARNTQSLIIGSVLDEFFQYSVALW